MALKKTFATKMGDNGEYINIDPPQLLSKTRAQVKANYWKNEEVRNTTGSLPYNDEIKGGRTERIIGFDTLFEFTYDLESPLNIFQQAYAYMKSQIEGCVDC